MDQLELLTKVYESVGRLEGKVDGYLNEHTELKTRVGKLEGQWAKLMGMFAVLTFPVTIAYKYITTRRHL